MADVDSETEGRVALVTGAASGMGRAAVERFADRGMRVCAVDIDQQSIDELAATTGCLAVRADVTDHAQVARAVDRCVDELGPIDLAFLNAGIPSNMQMATFDLATYQRVTGVNIDGVVFGIDAVGRAMRVRTDGRSGGTIVITASTAGLRPSTIDVFYTLTKYALVGFARSVAPALAAEGIALHTVCPGLTDTGFLGAMRPRLVEAGVPMIPPAAIADAILRIAAEPIETAGTVWILEDPDHLDPVPYDFHDLAQNEASRAMTSTFRT